MFTGIVEERGQVVSLEDRSTGTRLTIRARTVTGDTETGDSVAVNGVCLTVAERAGDHLAFDLAAETLKRSALGALAPGAPVNLERPLTLVTRLGGHLVQGHVDAVGTVRSVEWTGGGAVMTVSLPDELAPYVVEKGSIAVDGVSLTVAGKDDGAFRVALVPHTLDVTTLGDRGPGDDVNLEVDVMAKYVEQLLRRTT
ncbi:MAG: riboflavin synthase [Actinomycetota bacterium]|nr:riboflavin synthase [Actinomycetota bacterium]